MRITEVRIKLMESAEDRLRGFCSVTFDGCFVVRDLKIIDGNNGPFVAMPSRKLTEHCSKCRTKNHLRARFCNQCGNRLQNEQIEYDRAGRAKLYADIAHPVNAECRQMIQQSVIEALKREQELSAQPGYRPKYDENYESQLDYESEIGTSITPKTTPEQATPSDVPTELQPANDKEDSNVEETQPETPVANKRMDDSHSAPGGKHERPDSVPNSDVTGPRDDFGKGVF